MTDEPQGRPPDGGEEAATVEVGEPARDARDTQRRAREEERPDLDERERRIRTQRKPMGPPLEEPEGRAEPLAREVPPEPPTDPAPP
jgi:hypothetical protein